MGEQERTFFNEHRQILDMLHPQRFLDGSSEKAAKDICCCFERYQDCPEALDGHLEALVTATVTVIRQLLMTNKRESLEMLSVFHIVHILAKVRGFKVVSKCFPHKVSDLEPAYEFLKAQKEHDHSSWEVRHGLFLWLSMIILIPFDLQTVESEEHGALMERLVALGQSYLDDAGPTREAASWFLGKFFSRCNSEGAVSERLELRRFFCWARKILTTQSALEGPQESARLVLLKETPQVYDAVLGLRRHPFLQRGSSGKLWFKLVQRLGLVQLTPRLAPWRYRMGHRSLSLALEASQQLSKTTARQQQEDQVAGVDFLQGCYAQMKTSSANRKIGSEEEAKNYQEECEEDDELEEEAVEVEDVIDALLDGVRHTDTVIRWSAAKGLGRITTRLSLAMADQVIEQVVRLLSRAEGASAWNGGCLALAELARQGLLLPNRLKTVVPVVGQALWYEVRTGNHSIGANVRDGACYVVWAFARAYEAHIMSTHVPVLAEGLLALMFFDREINVRRAAAAAFQENVGRQGQFPHGIAIVGEADFWSLGNLQQAYAISVRVATFAPQYRKPLLEHLIQHKVVHWDPRVREISARTIGSFCEIPGLPTLVPAVISSALPLLLLSARSNDLCERHGALLAISEILISVSLPNLLAQEVCGLLLGDVAKGYDAIRSSRHGGELVCAGECRLLAAIAQACLALPPARVKRACDILIENLGHPSENVQEQAAQALGALSRNYDVQAAWTVDRGSMEQLHEFDRSQSFLEDILTEIWASVLPHVRPFGFGDLPSSLAPVKHEQSQRAPPERVRGLVMALGHLPLSLVLACPQGLSKFVATLVLSCDRKMVQDPETRRNSVCSMARIFEAIAVRAGTLSPGGPDYGSELARMLDCLCTCAGQQQWDKRGDVGSWVRSAALDAFRSCLPKIARLLGEERATRSEPVEALGRVLLVHSSDSIPAPDKVKPQVTLRVHPNATAEAVRAALSARFPHRGVRLGTHVLGLENEGKYWWEPDGALSTVSAVQAVARNQSDGKCAMEEENHVWNEKRCISIICAIVREAVGKLDALREVAGRTMHELIWPEACQVLRLPHLAVLRSVFAPKGTMVEGHVSEDSSKMPEESSLISLRSCPSYSKLANLLSCPVYLRPAMEGFVVSVGSLSSSDTDAGLVLSRYLLAHAEEGDSKASSDLPQAQRYRGSEQLVVCSRCLLDILEENIGNSPLPELGDFGSRALRLTRQALHRTRDFARLNAGLSIYLGLLPNGKVSKGSLSSALFMLGHRFPKMRRLCSQQLYSRLLSFEDSPEEILRDHPEEASRRLKESLLVLQSTEWSGDLNDASYRTCLKPHKQVTFSINVKKGMIFHVSTADIIEI
eukprot:g36921.t1